MMHGLSLRAALLVVPLLGGPAFAAQPGIRVHVDASRAESGVFHSHLVIPATPGPLVLTYPKWIPGEHSPTGPIMQMTGLTFQAGGRTLRWRRDPLDVFVFHVTVPAGVATIDADFDYLSPQESFGAGYGEGPNATSHLLVVAWNHHVLVPGGRPSDAVSCVPSLRLPTGWSLDSALDVAKRDGDEVEFAPVTLTALVDSPVLAGDRFRTVEIVGGEAPVRLSLAADDAADLAITDERVGQLRRIVAEAQALFGARHYRRYAWLVALTEGQEPDGLEHPESSDNRLPARIFLDRDLALAELRILPHEYVHSWNGKHRRPEGLATGDYEHPMDGELLWIYEGLTRYLGDVLLATRAGIRTPAETRDYLAWMASALEDARPGRRWRPLVDTAVDVQTLIGAPPAGSSMRRPLDYYEEAALVWLEADLLIRQRSGGQRSLDDFCRRFAGEPSGPPAIRPYSLDDVLSLLEEVQPNDWRAFFTTRIYEVAPHAPLGGLVAAGWRLAYDATPNAFAAGREKTRHRIDWTYGLGLSIKPDGTLVDVVRDSPAFRGGLVPGEKVVGVDGATWSPGALAAALQAAAGRTEPLTLVVERRDRLETVNVDFHGGARYPHLEQREGAGDGLAAVLAPTAAP